MPRDRSALGVIPAEGADPDGQYRTTAEHGGTEVTDEDVARHLHVVRQLCRPGGPLSADSARTTTRNPAWFASVGGALMPTPSRQLLHQTLLDDHRAAYPDVRHERRAIVMAGPPGAGKTAVRRRFIREVLDQAEADFVVIDADEFKTALMRQALVDGSYQSWLTPPEVVALQDAGQRVYPLEMSALVHQESVLLTQAARRIAVRDGADLVIDTVLQSAESALALGRQLQEAGYTISVLDAECSFDVSTARIRARWAQTYRDAVAGRDLLGGRWVPSEYAHVVFGGPGGMSRPAVAAAELANGCPVIMRYQVHRTVTVAGPTVLDVDRVRLDPGSELVQADEVAATQRRADPPVLGNTSPDEARNSVTRRGQADPRQRRRGL